MDDEELVERMLKNDNVDAVRPGSQQHTKVLELVNEYHEILGPILAEKHPDIAVDFVIAGIVYLGASLGLMHYAGMINVDDETLEGMLVNLKTGFDIGVNRAEWIEKETKRTVN